MYPEQFRLHFGSSTRLCRFGASRLGCKGPQFANLFANVIGHGNFLLSLKCAAAVLELLENLNRAVQSSSKSAASMISAMKMTVGALNDLRCEDKYQAVFEEAVKLCRETDVPLPALPRQRRPPR